MSFKTSAAAALLAVSASASFAQSAGNVRLTPTPADPGMLGATFERTVSGIFVDTFNFAPRRFSGEVAVSLAPVSGPVNFYSALLNGEPFSFVPEDNRTTFDFRSSVTSDRLLELQVFGYAGDAESLSESSGTYSASITAFDSVSAVPEPQTYALLVAGLLAIGAMRAGSARRR